MTIEQKEVPPKSERIKTSLTLKSVPERFDLKE
jgi:hypothetical protein